MSSCDLCAVCRPKKCPKKFGASSAAPGHIALSARLYGKLKSLCESRGFVKGEDYYRVPDYNSAISFLLNEYLKGRGYDCEA